MQILWKKHKSDDLQENDASYIPDTIKNEIQNIQIIDDTMYTAQLDDGRVIRWDGSNYRKTFDRKTFDRKTFDRETFDCETFDCKTIFTVDRKFDIMPQYSSKYFVAVLDNNFFVWGDLKDNPYQIHTADEKITKICYLIKFEETRYYILTARGSLYIYSNCMFEKFINYGVQDIETDKYHSNISICLLNCDIITFYNYENKS